MFLSCVLCRMIIPRFRSLYTGGALLSLWSRQGACGCNGGFVGTNYNFAVEEWLEGFVGAIESGGGCGVVAVEVVHRGGFVGTKCFVERAVDLGSDVDGGGEGDEDGFFGGRLGVGIGTEPVGDLGDGFVVVGCEFEGLARAEIVRSGIGRTSGFAFGSARSGGPPGIAPVCR